MSSEQIDPSLRAEIAAVGTTGSVIEVVDFLRGITPVGPWSLTAIRDGVLTGKTFDQRSNQDLNRWLRERLGRTNLYWQVNPLRRELTDKAPKARLEDVMSLDRLHVDIDPDHTAPGTVEEQRAAILALLQDEDRLKEAGLPGGPTIIVDSGNGYWAFWNLVEPLALGDGMAQERRDRAFAAGGYNKWLVEKLNAAFGFKFADDCHNIDRIARLPATLNIPPEKKRLAGRVATIGAAPIFYKDRVYQLSQFGHSQVGIAGLCQEELEAIVIPTTDWEPLPSGDPWEACQELMRRYPKVGVKTTELILQGEYVHNDGDDDITRTKESGETVTDRNRAHWRVNLALQRAGVPLGLVAAILKDKRFPVSEHLRFPANKDGSRARYEVTGGALDRATEHQVRKAAGKLIAEAKAEEAALEQMRAAEAVLADAPADEQCEAPADTGTVPRTLQFDTDKQGKPLPTERNIIVAMRRLGVTVFYDRFANKLIIEGLADFGPELSDAAMTRLRLVIDRRFAIRIKKEYFYDVVGDQAQYNKVHPVLQYLDKLQWDGVQRLDKWLITYGKAKNTPYVQAVSKLMLIAAVRRLRRPGAKFDEMAVLEGIQGTNKSTALKVLAVNEEWYTDELPLGSSSKEMIEQLTGKWIIEIADLHKRGGADVNRIKAQLSRTEDRARLAYERLTGTLKRQCVFFGTTNEDRYLKDPTGERRFWPVMTGGFDIEALKLDRDQLWAEAVAREATGESIRMDKSLWEEAAQEQSGRAVIDPWTEVIESAIGSLNGKIRANDVWTIIGMPIDRRTTRDSTRVSNAMKQLGFRHASLRFSGDKAKGYCRGTPNEELEEIIAYRDRVDGALRVQMKDARPPDDEEIPF